MQLEAVARTDPGPVREHNEDSFTVDLETGLFLVADGMGGHASGEIASAIAVDTVQEVLLGGINPDETRLDRNMGMDDEEEIRERLRYSMNQASVRIRQAAIANPAHTGMGTTLVVLLIEDDEAHIGHVGDSRIYLFRDDRLLRLTRDHTVVQQEIDAGRLTPELARIVPHKNILTQSVGYHGPVEPDTSTRPVEPGDVFILCTDGLTDPLSDEQLTDLCRDNAPEDLAEVLVQAALQAGTEDNVTVVVVAAGD
jgi:serine/threonine protein phosphatase PrpC